MSATLYMKSPATWQRSRSLLTEVGGELPDEVAEAAIDAWLEETGTAHDARRWITTAD